MLGNPLLTEEMFNQMVQGHGNAKAIIYAVGRRTGQTTAHALAAMATAISNPYNKIVLLDHDNGCSRLMAHRVQQLIEAAQLQHMHVYQCSGHWVLEFNENL